MPNSVTSIENGTFEYCSGLTSVTIPNSVTRIGGGAFYNCSGLISVTIPNSVTSIEGYAFSGCSSLISVTIPNSVTSIEGYAFQGCSNLTLVTFHCKEIGSWFSGFSSIKEVIIGEEVESIEGYAFYRCSGLTSITIPKSVKSIGTSAFENCSNIKKVIASDIAAWCKINFENEYANPLNYANRLYLDESTEIQDLVIPDSVTSIGHYAFSDCLDLISVTIGNSVTSIGKKAFYGCSNLYSVVFGTGVTTVGDDAFSACSIIKYVIASDIAAWCKINFGNVSANPLCYAKRLYIDKNTVIQDLVIPDSVKSIGERAFYGCTDLYSVTFGSGLTSVGIDAFGNCSNIKKVIVPDITAWCGIGFATEKSNPLFYAKHLYKDKNTEIQNLVIPDGVTGIGTYTFSGCSGLTSVTIPNSVTSIGSSAFSGCSSLNSVTIPNNVTSIAQQAFAGCSSLNSITFNCKEIGAWFKNLASIKEVVIGKDVTSIAQQAFAGCSNLQSIYSKVEDVFTISLNTFTDNHYSYAKLYVPIGKKADYEDTPWWSNFANIEEYDYGTDAPVDQPKCQTPTISSQGGALTVQGIDDGTQVSVYSVNGTQVGTAVVQNGQATVSTTLQSGSIAIVKIGQKSVKVLLR